ncbi:MAG: hypothetical protein Q9191_006024, partial [Dirinaria sp. TL-2023a]
MPKKISKSDQKSGQASSTKGSSTGPSNDAYGLYDPTERRSENLSSSASVQKGNQSGSGKKPVKEPTKSRSEEDAYGFYDPTERKYISKVTSRAAKATSRITSGKRGTPSAARNLNTVPRTLVWVGQYFTVDMQEDEQVGPIEMQTRRQQPNQRLDQDASEVYRGSPSKEANKAQHPGYRNQVHNHRDLFRRFFKGKDWHEKFLSPYDGRLCDLIVQSSNEVPNSPYEVPNEGSKARWLRTGLCKRGPWIIRLSNWAMSRDHASEDKVGTDIGTATL